RIGAVALHDDPADCFAAPVQLADAAALIGTEFDPRDIAHQHRCSLSRLRLEHHPSEIVDAAEITATAHHVFGLAHLDRPAADIAVAGPHRFAYPRQRDAVGLQLARIDDDLVLALEPA